MLTNNDCDFIKKLYAKYNIKTIDVKRMINCDSNNRVGKEVIITNYDMKSGIATEEYLNKVAPETAKPAKK